MAEAPLCLYVVSTEVNGLGTKVFSSEETSRRSTFGPFEFAWKSHDQGATLRSEASAMVRAKRGLRVRGSFDRAGASDRAKHRGGRL